MILFINDYIYKMTQRLISYNYDHNFEREKVSKMN